MEDPPVVEVFSFYEARFSGGYMTKLPSSDVSNINASYNIPYNNDHSTHIYIYTLNIYIYKLSRK